MRSSFLVALLALTALPHQARAAPAAKSTKAAPAAKASPAKSGGDSAHGLGFAGGLHIAYPPLLTAELRYQPSKYFEGGFAMGYMQLPLADFQGTSTYMGLDLKGIAPNGFFGGLAIGRRTFEITTTNKLTVNEDQYDIHWTRHVSQMIYYPRAGWMRVFKGGHALSIAAGMVIPTGTSFSMDRDKNPEGEVAQKLLADEEIDRENDVTKVTNTTTPSIELKYGFYLK